MGCSQGHFIRLNEVLDQLRQSSALPQSEGCSFEGILHESKKKKKSKMSASSAQKKYFYGNMRTSKEWGYGIWNLL